jgi:hypothetical protein
LGEIQNVLQRIFSTVAKESAVRRWSFAAVILTLAMMSASCALTPPGFTNPDTQTLTLAPP